MTDNNPFMFIHALYLVDADVYVLGSLAVMMESSVYCILVYRCRVQYYCALQGNKSKACEH